MSSESFDSVRLVLDGETQLLTREEFLQIPLTKRVRYLLSEVLYFSSEGKDVKTRDALKSLAAADAARARAGRL